MAIVAPVPQVGQECMWWCVPVRSAHKDCEDTHQPKIAACISFSAENLKNKSKSRMASRLQLKAAISSPWRVVLPACPPGVVNREKHSHRSRVHPFSDAHDGHELWRRCDRPEPRDADKRDYDDASKQAGDDRKGHKRQQRKPHGHVLVCPHALVNSCVPFR